MIHLSIQPFKTNLYRYHENYVGTCFMDVCGVLVQKHRFKWNGMERNGSLFDEGFSRLSAAKKWFFLHTHLNETTNRCARYNGENKEICICFQKNGFGLFINVKWMLRFHKSQPMKMCFVMIDILSIEIISCCCGVFFYILCGQKYNLLHSFRSHNC